MLRLTATRVLAVASFFVSLSLPALAPSSALAATEGGAGDSRQWLRWRPNGDVELRPESILPASTGVALRQRLILSTAIGAPVALSSRVTSVWRSRHPESAGLRPKLLPIPEGARK